MFSLTIEPTNLCNRSCLHCLRDRIEPRQSISPDLVQMILKEARDLGFAKIHITGGELALYPDLESLISMIVDCDFRFDLVTNGYRFRDRMLPLLTQSTVRKKLIKVCLSLDGATAAAHDAIRGEGSFREVMEATTLCRMKEIPTGLKSIISNYSKNELTEIALLGATLGASDLSFISLLPTPRLIKESIIPSPAELEKKIYWIMESLAKSVKIKINIDAYSFPSTVFCCGAFNSLSVDFQGNLLFCCALSHVVDEGQAPAPGQEFEADLKKVPLREGIALHFELLAKLMRQRLSEAGRLNPVSYIPCYWCYNYFGKLNWLKNYPQSPWAAGILNDRNEK